MTSHSLAYDADLADDRRGPEEQQDAATGNRRISVLARFIELLLPPREASQVLRGFYTDALHTP